MNRRAATAAISLVLLAAGCVGDSDDDPTGSTRLLAGTPTTTAEPAGDEDEAAGDGAPTTTTAQESVADLSAAAIVLTEVARLSAPTSMAVRPGSGDLYVTERAGTVRAIALRPVTGGGVRAEVGPPLVDVSTSTDGERGLLGLAFHPDGTHVYLSYTDRAGDTQVDEMAIDGAAIDAGSRRSVFSTEQPFANHNGGQISFGPDGYLYLALGDGGGGGDPLGTAQDPGNVLGSILRFDPRPGPDGSPRQIPGDNPFAGGGGAPEVWITGVRNPWRFSWDRATDDLWIADVGQNAIEEITLLPADGSTSPGRAANLGWPIFEGEEPFAGGDAPDGYVAPIHTYELGPGCSITGGYVSRGDALPGLRGAYLYSDYCDPTIRAVLQRDGELVEERSLDVEVPGGSVVSFGEGPDGELYVLSLSGGIYRIDPA
ncbi:MAG: PQQ-dependent sugar dehydrogenase [Acidimicrobiia bacterium]|nr:PQQ-dependent sugar dehydrogenase [Acidimicrobiia bacterium]